MYGENVNFEIGKGQYERIKKYAGFFCMTTNRFMQMLITMGIADFKNDYQQLKSVYDNICEMKIMRAKREEYNEIQRKVYKAKKDKNARVDDLEGESRKVRLEIQRYVTRVKIKLSEKCNKELKNITKEIRRERNELCKSDVICSLMQFELDTRLQYLTREKDLLNERKYYVPNKVVINIPQEFYDFICNQAVIYNVEPEDFLKILIEEKYDEVHRKK